MPAKKFMLDKYVDEALKPDFELGLSEDDSIIVKVPTVEEVLDLNTIVDVRAQLQILLKKDYPRLMEAIGEQPGPLLKPLMNDMLQHFGLGG